MITASLSENVEQSVEIADSVALIDALGCLAVEDL